MNGPTITRREALKAGSDHLVLLLLALLAAGAPSVVAPTVPAEPVMPDWLRDTPPWMLPKLERIIAASNRMGFEGYPGATLEGFWESAARVFETAAKPRGGES